MRQRRRSGGGPGRGALPAYWGTPAATTTTTAAAAAALSSPTTAACRTFRRPPTRCTAGIIEITAVVDQASSQTRADALLRNLNPDFAVTQVYGVVQLPCFSVICLFQFGSCW